MGEAGQDVLTAPLSGNGTRGEPRGRVPLERPDRGVPVRLRDRRGKPFLAELRAPVLITDPVRRQQARLNFFESTLVRVVETAGFAERYTLNAAPQGMWLKTPPTTAPALDTQVDANNVTWYLHPVAHHTDLGVYALDTDARYAASGRDAQVPAQVREVVRSWGFGGADGVPARAAVHNFAL